MIMDSSSVRSDSKVSSDFSIKRILAEDSESVREDVSSPSWLCCTRYRPPRLPRATTASAGRSRRSGRHARVPFTPAQAAALEAAYSRAPYLAPPALRALAAALHLRDDRIKIWFQNRRARERREKCGAITPPTQAMTLPPTSPPGVMVFPSSSWFPRISDQQIERSSEKVETTTKSISFEHRGTSVSFPLFPNHSSEDESFEDRCDSPLDVETVTD